MSVGELVVVIKTQLEEAEQMLQAEMAGLLLQGHF
jgi:hypothetical protein